MFEYEQATVDQLLHSDTRFKRLYEKHSILNAKVDNVTSGYVPMSQLELETLKKEKLMLRDRLQAMIQAHSARH